MGIKFEARRVIFIADEEMPRTATGKNLHRLVHERAAEWLAREA